MTDTPKPEAPAAASGVTISDNVVALSLIHISEPTRPY